MTFWEEAARLRIEGVGFSADESPVSGPIFEVANAEALAALKDALKGRYRILVCGDDDNYVVEDHKEAIEFIERVRPGG
jgi:CRISPR/Cas system-associated protein Csx1